jgi:hypothetical protein
MPIDKSSSDREKKNEEEEERKKEGRASVERQRLLDVGSFLIVMDQ